MTNSLTVGTDTYISIEDADAYMEGRLNSADWFNADNLDANLKVSALHMATKMIDRQRYIGRIASLTQPLAWPRIGHTVIDAQRGSWQADAFQQYASSPLIGAGVVDQEGRILPSNAIPPAIAQATAELALFLMRYDITDDRVRRGVFSVRSERIGEAGVTYDSAGSNENGLPAIVRDMIAPFLVSGGGCSARLVF